MDVIVGSIFFIMILLTVGKLFFLFIRKVTIKKRIRIFNIRYDKYVKDFDPNKYSEYDLEYKHGFYAILNQTKTLLTVKEYLHDENLKPKIIDLYCVITYIEEDLGIIGNQFKEMGNENNK